MKNIILTLLILALCLLSLEACDDAKKNVSDGEAEMSKTVSSTPEVSMPDASSLETSNTEGSQTEAYVWYGQKELDQWFAEMKAGWEKEESIDGKHVRFYHQVDITLQNYIGQEKVDAYFTFALNTEHGCTQASVCEYFGISREEYIALYDDLMERVGKASQGEKPKGIYGIMDFYRYDAIFSEQFWNHPDYLLSSYVVPEIDDYYTSLKDRNGYMRVYYIIDRLLIEHVGVDEFEKWLEEKEDVDQNILNFVEHFGITRETYDGIYEDIEPIPYNPDYLFGTPEMQDEYFKVHPLK